MAGVWVFAETVDGVPKPVVLELLTKARSLGDATAIALGPGASKSAEALGQYGPKSQEPNARPDSAESRRRGAGRLRRRAGGTDADRSGRPEQAGRPSAAARNRKGERAQTRGCHDHRQWWARAGCAGEFQDGR